MEKVLKKQMKGISGFFKTRFNWVLQAQEYHNNLVKILKAIGKELQVKPEDVLDIIKQLLNVEELKRKEKRIRDLEEERDNL